MESSLQRRSWTTRASRTALVTTCRSFTARSRRPSELAQADYTDEQLRRVLGGVGAVDEGLGSLRNREGMLTDALGRGYRPSPRQVWAGGQSGRIS